MARRYRSRVTIGQTIFVATVGVVVTLLGIAILSFVIVFSGSSRALIESQSKEINKQIVFNFERYITSVVETADYTRQLVSTHDLADEEEHIGDILRVSQELKPDVESIILFDQGGRRVIGNEIRHTVMQSGGRPIWFAQALSRPEIYHFGVGMSTNMGVDRTERVLTVSRHVSYLSRGDLHAGVLLVEINTDGIRNLSDKTNLGEFGHIIIIDESGTLVFASSESDYFTESFPLAAATYLGGGERKILGLDMYLHINTLTGTRWRLATIGNIDSIIVARRRLFAIVAAIGVASFFVTAGVAAFVSYRISYPISQLTAIMKRIEQGEMDTPIDVHGQYEIVELSVSFRQMVAQIRELMQRVVTQQREKRKTELRALQNQINPHFLYNTLDSIVWLAENNRTSDVVTTVVGLAKFFRISLSKGAIFIPVRSEIEQIKNYLTIQRTRYVNKFRYRLEISDAILDYRVMKLILQPVVENAIYHGMGDDNGMILITAERYGSSLVFRVRDSGYGVTERKIAELYEVMRGVRHGASVGLRNVYQRLKLYYGDGADVRIESVLDESTTVTLIIPIAVPLEEES